MHDGNMNGSGLPIEIGINIIIRPQMWRWVERNCHGLCIVLRVQIGYRYIGWCGWNRWWEIDLDVFFVDIRMVSFVFLKGPLSRCRDLR
jgi:hypothetical protein